MAEPSAWAADRAFAIESARRAGVVLMDRYERLERIHHKSAKDVVTEADHLSEELIISVDPRALAGRRHARRGVGRPRAGRRRLGDGRVRPGLGHRPPRRDGQLRQRDPVLLRLDRPGRRRPARGRRRAGPVARRDVRRRRGRPGAPRRPRQSSRPADHRLGQGVAQRLRHRALRVGPGRGDPRPTGSARRSGSGGTWAPPRSSSPTSRTVASTPSSSRAGLSTWDIAAAGLIAERAGATITDASGGPWFDLSRKGNVNGIVAAPSRFHAEVLALSR